MGGGEGWQSCRSLCIACVKDMTYHLLSVPKITFKVTQGHIDISTMRNFIAIYNYRS